MITRLCLLPPEAALALSAARIRLLRRSYDGLGGFDETSPAAVVRAVSFRELPDRTVDLFHAAIYLGTDEGREAICEAARMRKDLAPWLLLTPLDVAIDVARAAERGDDVARAIQKRALAEGAPPATRAEPELATRTREAPERIEAIVEAGREVHGERFVEGWALACRDGVVRAVVLHEGRGGTKLTRSVPPPAPEEAREAREARKSGEWSVGPRGRPSVLCDTIRWDAKRGRVGFALARGGKLREWRVKLCAACGGEALFEA